MLTIDSIEALSTRVEALRGYLNIDQKRMEVMDDEKQTHNEEVDFHTPYLTTTFQ